MKKMSKSKVLPVMIEIEQEKLQEIYRELCETVQNMETLKNMLLDELYRRYK